MAVGLETMQYSQPIDLKGRQT